MEFRGQNLGTEIASEELCRNLTGFNGNTEVTDSIRIWCGTNGSQRTFTKGKITHTVPAFYYKIIDYFDKVQQRQVEVCYWLPNQPGEVQDKLDERRKTYAELCTLLNFRPKDIFR
jgi:DNA/RNA endonuclease G (NUC1)